MEDIFGDIEKAADEDNAKKQIDLGPISRLVKKQAILEGPANPKIVGALYTQLIGMGGSVKDLEEALKILNKDLFQVRQVQIPELMKEFGLDGIQTDTGTKIEIKDGISVSVRDKEKLHAYIRSQDSGDLIKDSITIETDTEESRKEVMELLEKIDCMFERKEGIHSGTLKKFIKDGLAKGNKPPDEAVNIYEYRFSKIKK